MDKRKTLIIGIGNLILKDEGIGIHLVKRLKTYTLPSDVELIDGGTNTIELLSQIQGAKKVIIIDALRAGQEPGTIYRMTPESLFKDSWGHLSLHEMDIIDVLGIAEQLGGYGEVIIIGIEPKEITWGMELSPDIEKKLPKIIDLIFKEL